MKQKVEYSFCGQTEESQATGEAEKVGEEGGLSWRNAPAAVLNCDEGQHRPGSSASGEYQSKTAPPEFLLPKTAVAHLQSTHDAGENEHEEHGRIRRGQPAVCPQQQFIIQPLD